MPMKQDDMRFYFLKRAARSYKMYPSRDVNLKSKLLEFGQPNLESIEISERPLPTQLIVLSREERKARLMDLR